MSNVTAEFVQDPSTFLTRYVVLVANGDELGDSNKAGVRTFYLWKSADTSVLLKEHRFGKAPSSTVKAYWLPWKTMTAVSMDVGSEADYFFTSQMTGCRFSVLTKEGEPPKVAHIAGTLKQADRTKEEDKLVTAMGGSGTVTARRLSVSGNKDHGYVGQTVDPSSAFVYGVRNQQSGAWTFAAQIVGANLVPTVNLASVPVSAIKPAFTFG